MRLTTRKATPLIAATLVALVLLWAVPVAADAVEEPVSQPVDDAPLAKGAGYKLRHGSDRVRELQRRLRLAGQRPGPIDGRFGERTKAAVIRFQRARALTANGMVDVATMGALERATGSLSQPALTTPPVRGRALDRRVSALTATAAHGARSAVGTAATIVLAAAIPLIALPLALARVRPARRLDNDAPTRGDREVPGEAAPLEHSAPNPRGLEVFGYASVPADGEDGNRQELRVQLQAIIAECRARGLVLLDIIREREPDRGKGLSRPGLEYALRRIAEGDAQGIVVAELWRVSRSVADVGEVLEWFMRNRARFVAADPGLDTAEQSGILAARTIVELSKRERQRLRERTRRGLEAARRKGRRGGPGGVADHPQLREDIIGMRTQGMTLQAIADQLNAQGVPTVRGGRLWRPSSVQAAVGYRRPQQTSHGANGWRVPDPDPEKLVEEQ